MVGQRDLERSAAGEFEAGKRERGDVVTIGTKEGGDLVPAHAPSQNPGTRIIGADPMTASSRNGFWGRASG